MSVILLHTNDLHGKLSVPIVERIRSLSGPTSLYLDSGDCIRTGNLGVPLRQEPVWAWLEEAGCAASTLGNRESHVLESAFRLKISGARHPLVCANFFHKDGTLVLDDSVVLVRAGLRVGIVGIMVPMVTRSMASSAASAFIWGPPIECAAGVANRLRPEVDLLIALTHIGHRQDVALAEACPLFDVILGGHSHAIIAEPLRVGSTWICQGGSHGRYVGRYEWLKEERRLVGSLLEL